MPQPSLLRLPVERLDAVLLDPDGVLLENGSLPRPDPQPADRGAGFDGAADLLARLGEAGVAAALTSTRYTRAELLARGVAQRVAVIVDADDAERERLAAPPDPALLLRAAQLSGVHPARAAVLAGTTEGVQAACRGGFGLVVGVDRSGVREAELCRYGADAVLTGVSALQVDREAGRRRWWQPLRPVSPAAEQAGWLLDYTGVDPDAEGVRETLCTLGNGYLATRGAASEAVADQRHYPGTYLAGIFNRLRSRVHGHIHEDESLVNLPNWLLLQWRPEAAPWVLPSGPGISDYRQSLDLRAGVLHHRYRHVDGHGRATTVVSKRLVSMAAPHLAALEMTFVAENWSGTLQVRSAVDGRVTNGQVAEYEPLAGHHLFPEGQGRDGSGGLWLRMRTSQSRVDVGVATRTRVRPAGGAPDGPCRRATMARARPQETYIIPIREGEPVRVQKAAAYYTSRDRGITEPVAAARQAVAQVGSFTDLLTAHVRAWRRLWERSRVELHTSSSATVLALNLHTFHLLASTSPNVVDLDAGVGARGLHGEGYHGHIFWDEVFVHRALALHLPEVSRALLLYRWRRLDAARRAAAAAGYQGALFPWQSGSDGREETPSEVYNPRTRRWMPDRTAYQRHVGLAIAYSVWQYYQATADVNFLYTYGAELILEIARFFADLVRENPTTGRYEITRVMGPDELHDAYPGTDVPGLANNAYTNVMTVWLLRRALDVADLLACHYGPDLTDLLGLGEQERVRWRRITTRMYVPWHGAQIISQFDGYADLREFDVSGYLARYGDISRLHLILAAEGDSPNRYRIGKQADVLMLLYLLSAEELRELLAGLGYPWPRAALPRTVDFYSGRVSHGSTLSRVVHAWVHARAGRAISWDYFMEALAADLGDSKSGSTREGIHLGAMAGTLDLAERCYLGVEIREDALWFNPRLPREVSKLHTLLTYRGQQVHVTADQSVLALVASPCAAAPITVRVAGQPPLRLEAGEQRSIALKPAVPAM
ncbi:MAG TPA: glycosyl hydrolase family 65 protein [Micromonospora sp.]|nr:glycosyl hydrolase family 65 protein [Micromonospora sp.]